MESKKPSGKGSGEKRKMMTMDVKKEIVEMYEDGVRVAELARAYGRNPSTISTIIKQKDAIKSARLAKGSTVMSQLRTALHEEMERLLLIWVQEKELAGDTVPEIVIREKARAIYGELSRNSASTSKEEPEETFKASRGWFEKFKKRTGIHSAVKREDDASSDSKAAEEFAKRFAELIAEEAYTPRQVFNCYETALFWKKVAGRTYITAEEVEEVPGHKAMNDRLTLVLSANVTGDCKLKPLLVHHSGYPRVFKTHKIPKEKLKVMWRAKANAWVTRKVFVEWVNIVFGPTVKRYLEENGLPVKALLILDNAPAHPPDLQDDILDEFKFVEVLYLPPNVTAVLRPMSQHVISNFKKFYTKNMFCRCYEVTESTQLTMREFWKNHQVVKWLNIVHLSWQEVPRGTLNSAWKKLWPAATKSFQAETEVEPLKEIVWVGVSTDQRVDEHDTSEPKGIKVEPVDDLVKEEVKEMEDTQQDEYMEETCSEEEEEEGEVSTSEIHDMLNIWDVFSSFIMKHHPEKVATGRALDLCDDTCLTYFRNILKDRQMQGSLDISFIKSESGEIGIKKAGSYYEA